MAINGEVAAIRGMLLEADYAELVSYTIVLQEAATYRVSFTVLLEGEDYEPWAGGITARLIIRDQDM